MNSDSYNTLHGDWNYPTPFRFGVGRIVELVALCKQYHITCPLVITDSSLVSQDFIIAVFDMLREGGLNIGVFSNVKPNPDGKNIEMGVDAYRKGKHDGVVAIGGGSAIDAGKTVAFMAGQSRSLWDFEDIGDNWRRADILGIAPCIAVPTTAGTGSEVGRAAVILDKSCSRKKIIFHPAMMPKHVLADAELTVGLPAALTAATGIDALVHNMEAYFAATYHPMADGIALEGMRLIKAWLPRAFVDGNDLEARSQMLVASSMGATAFQKGLGGVHAIAHTLGALYDAHHGLLNAILLPYVMQANRIAIEDKSRHIARYLALAEPSFESLLTWVLALRKQLNIPHSLYEIGIDDKDKLRIGEMSLQDPSAGGNPVPLTEKQYSAIFVDAVKGKLH